MRIAVDIDSTLHHYWDVLSDAAKRRFGIELPYDEQLSWGISRLKPRQLEACIRESHSDAAIASARPYEGAVEAVRRWHEAGHEIYVMSHRAETCHAVTGAWLDRIGLPYDELHCALGKVERCRELGVDVLVDDSPANIVGALEAGMVAATIAHPWNRDVCETEDVVCARDWPELAARLSEVLGVPGPEPVGAPERA